MTFDYSDDDGPDIDTVRSIAADMADAGKPPPMSDEEREEWRAWREQEERLAEHQRRERERRRAKAEQAKLAQERQTAAVERAERNRQLQEQIRQRADRQMQSRQLSDLYSHALEQRQFRHATLRANAQAAARQDLSDTLDNWLAAKFPPPPEPTVVVVQEDDGSADFGSRNFDVAKWSKKPRSWW